MRVQVILLVLLMIPCLAAGCASRPDEGVLASGPSPSGAEVVNLYAVTNRIRHAPSSDDPTPSFSDARATILSATRFSISVPPAHKTGNIEWPGRDPDPLVAMTVAARQDMPLSALIDDIASGPRRADVRIFVHGYNTSLQEGLFRLAQVTYDSGGEGAAILFSWPSTATMVGYAADREAVTYSRDHLTELLTMLARDKRIGQITVLGHSMGGWLVMETLRQLRLIGDDPTLRRLQVVLAAPDIDVDVFRAQLRAIGPLDPPLTVLVAPDDRALRISARLNAGRPRVGALNVGDPRIAVTAEASGVALIDVGDIRSPDAQGHSRYAMLAALYPSMRLQPGQAISDAGAFVLERTGMAATGPFILSAGGITSN